MEIEPGQAVGYDRARDRPPARPRTLADLPFERQPAVRWYSPSVLAAAGLQVAMSTAFGAYLDKRELQTVIAQEPFTDLAEREEAWIDFVADTGDGFDATYTIASLVGRAQLEVDGLTRALPRADVLTFGGDLVYPDATAHGYEHRFEGPYKAALPWTPPDGRPALFALPGNHDWYDGLTSFMRVFGQQKTIGGWQTYQTRSYYALELPHRWWLWGVDIEFDAYIDEPQLRFFDAIALAPGDRVILCTAEPSWVGTAAYTAAYRNLAYVERRIILPKGAEVALALSGDLHHYARYEAEGGQYQKVTAGGGGAFLHGTHDLPGELPVRSDPDDPATETVHRLTTTYPAQGRSRLLALGTLGLPLRNPSFMLMPAVVYVLLVAQVLGALKARAAEAVETADDSGERLVEALAELTFTETFARMFSEPLALGLLVVVLVALVVFPRPPRALSPGSVRWAKRAMGVAHTALHVVAVALVAWATLRLAAPTGPGWQLTTTAYVLAFLLGAVIGSLAFALYLTVANGIWGAEGNHAFSAQRRAGHKNFLRLHVRADGSLVVYAIGVERSGTRWKAVPDAEDDEAAWVAPASSPPSPHLIEEITLAPAGQPSDEVDR